MKAIVGLLGAAAALVGLWLAFMWVVGKGCESAIKDVEQHGLRPKVVKIWYGADGVPMKAP